MGKKRTKKKAHFQLITDRQSSGLHPESTQFLCLMPNLGFRTMKGIDFRTTVEFETSWNRTVNLLYGWQESHISPTLVQKMTYICNQSTKN